MNSSVLKDLDYSNSVYLVCGKDVKLRYIVSVNIIFIVICDCVIVQPSEDFSTGDPQENQVK